MFMHSWVGPHSTLPSDELYTRVYSMTRTESIVALECEDKRERRESAALS